MLTRSFSSSTAPHQQGSALLEGLIAVLIFSLGILGIVGIQASTTHAVTQAKSRVDATFIASQKVAEGWNDMSKVTSKSLAESNTDISLLLPSGKRTTTVSDTGLVTVTVTWRMPGESEDHSVQAIAQITGN